MSVSADYDDNTMALQGSQKLGLPVRVIRKVMGPNHVQTLAPHAQTVYVYCGKYEVGASAFNSFAGNMTPSVCACWYLTLLAVPWCDSHASCICMHNELLLFRIPAS